MASQPNRFISVGEYLSLEDNSVERHEYLNGEMFAMAGGSPDHARIAANLIREIGNVLRPNCEILGSDLGLKLPSGLYTYADATISCQAQFDGNFLLNPSTIIEILSDSTEAYDRGRKFEQYRELASLEEYVLLAQDRMYVELHRRQEGAWMMVELKALSDTILLSHAGSITLSSLYAGVSWLKKTVAAES